MSRKFIFRIIEGVLAFFGLILILEILFIIVFRYFARFG